MCLGSTILKRFRKREMGDGPPRTPCTHSEKTIVMGGYPISYPSYSWIPIPKASDPLPPGIVEGGQIKSGEICYIGKGIVQSMGGRQTLCGFFTNEARQLHACDDKKEFQLGDFEMLVVDNQEGLCWKKCNRDLSTFRSPLMPLTFTKHLWPSFAFITAYYTILTVVGTDDHITSMMSSLGRTDPGIRRPDIFERSLRYLYQPTRGNVECFPHHDTLMMKPSPGKLKNICRYVILNSLNPVSLEKSVEELPLPGKVKKFLEEPPERFQNYPEHLTLLANSSE